MQNEGQIMNENSQLQTPQHPSMKHLEVDTGKLSSVVLARLIEEIRNDKTPEMQMYDRVHNRHNRGR